jgi:hypothetical protein
MYKEVKTVYCKKTQNTKTVWAEQRLLGAVPGGGNLGLEVRILFMKPQLTGKEVLLKSSDILAYSARQTSCRSCSTPSIIAFPLRASFKYRMIKKSLCT